MESKTKYRDGAYLNNRQKKWFDNFQKQYPTAELVEVCKGLSGDRILTITWAEDLPKIIIPECEVCGAGFIRHKLRVQLRVFGDPRKSAEYSYSISHRSCNLELYELVQVINKIAGDKNYCSGEGQLSLAVSPILEVPIPRNPVIIKNKFSVNRKVAELSYNAKQLRLF